MQIGSRTLIMNPVSGTGDHADYVRRMARGKGFAVWETEGAGDGVKLGREAAQEGVGEVAVCGGDGTINEVLRGLAAEDHLGEVTLDIVPAGTANLLAGNLGIHDVEHGLALTDKGEVRSLDIGMADGEPFAVSCIAGFPADASTAASGELKSRLGTLAFVVTGVQQAVEFDGLSLELSAHGGGETQHWAGSAVTVLVGNARKFVEEGGQADMEDGLFDVAVVEDVPAGNLAVEAAIHRLLGEGTDSVHHFRAAQVTVESDEPITFSRDGEIAEHDGLTMYARPQALDVRVGPEYQPDPGGT
jgi:YegS/Rv2252/BmrU family lipid kinase